MSVSLNHLLAIAFGGAAGAISRYLMVGTLKHYLPGFPWGTLCVNLLGCFVAGYLLEAFSHGLKEPPELRLLVMVGFLGSLTTFSAFSIETLELWLQHSPLRALFNLALNLVGSMGAVSLGYVLARIFYKV